MSARSEIGAVVPVYNSERSVEAVVRGFLAFADDTGISCRVVLVDDQSADRSAAILDSMALTDGRITAVHLSQNSGQQAALLCGLALAAGDCRYLLTMDDDLQHPAQVAGQLYARIQEGYDLVYAIPYGEKRPLCRRMGSLLRDILFSLCTAKPRGVRVSSFRMMTAELAQKICAEHRQFVYLSASAFRYTPKTANLFYRQQKRAYGSSGYSLRKLAGVYGNLFRYYTVPGTLFCPKGQGAPYQIASIVERGGCYGKTDGSRRFQLPEERADCRTQAWTSNRSD
ncbi:MAG: glycosyltransferase [Ruminococcaceae bacterium]|jgi:undecaprenyl-phosphate 4-deoxy-4-formamido-L-arabinose transferase|nr:glycosyltransferase [Oscillospiraceae bacterium]